VRFACLLVFAACATPLRPAHVAAPAPDLSTSPNDLEEPDLSEPMTDLAAAADLAFAVVDLGAPDLTPLHDLSSLPDLSVVCVPRLNEVQTGTATSGYEEFVEIYNPCTTPLSLSGLELVYRSADGVKDTVLVADLQVTVAGHGFAVFAGGSYFTTVRQGQLSSGMAETGGGVAIRDAASTVLDELAWGTATNAFASGSVPPAPRDRTAPGRSLARSPDGSGGFALTIQPTAGAANVIR
jgi:hypothetical protein